MRSPQSLLSFYLAYSMLTGPCMTGAWTSSPIDRFHSHASTKGKAPFRTQQWITSDNDGNKRQELTSSTHNVRRSLIQSIATATTSLFVLVPSPSIVHADDNLSTTLYQRNKENLAYQIQLPNNFKETQKPLKTHLDEVNFVADDVKGYQYGITVDPVRINSLKEFGTPEQVAARVVTAEVNRDGIFEVTLLEDPYEVNGAYILHYLSVGKRGNKDYYNKIFIVNNQLYVLTAQVKQEDFAAQTNEIKRVVSSFQVTHS